jgi:hypothetical protein
MIAEAEEAAAGRLRIERGIVVALVAFFGTGIPVTGRVFAGDVCIRAGADTDCPACTGGGCRVGADTEAASGRLLTLAGAAFCTLAGTAFCALAGGANERIFDATIKSSCPRIACARSLARASALCALSARSAAVADAGMARAAGRSLAGTRRDGRT